MTMEDRERLQDTIRQGTAPPIIKRRAARGSLPVSSDELLDILVFLLKDPDTTCSDVAKQTLESWPAEKWCPLLAEPDLHPDTLSHFAAHPDLPDESVSALAKHPKAGDATLTALAKRLTMPQIYELLPSRERALKFPEFAKAVLHRKDVPADLLRLVESAVPSEEVAAARGATGAKTPKQRKSVTQMLQEMSIPEKIAFAPKATREAILIMIRDPSKLIYRAALTSPKMGNAEAETVAGLKNVNEEVLRALGTDRKWLKSRVVIRNLANNPRTPIDVALTLIKMLSKLELKNLGANRNVAEPVRVIARKMLKVKS